MHFLHPLFLIGLAGVSAPILVHLVFKMKARVVPFPSVRFLRQIERQVTRRQKVQQWLVLLLRCLTILLLILALAGPVYKPSGGAFGSGGAAVAIVLDDSYSMSLADTEGALFARAKAASLRILKTLRPGDAACLLTSRREPVLSRDLGALEAEMRNLEPSLGASTLRPLVEAAMKLLRETPAAQRELYVVSDFQVRAMDLAGVGWEVRNFTPVLVPIRSPRRDNLTIEALEAVSPFATTAAPWRVRVRIANRGPETCAKNLTLRVDEVAVASQIVQVAGRNSAAVATDLRFDRPGWRSVSAELENDALAPDNRRFLSVDVRPRLKVLLCRPEAGGPLSRSYYIEKALAPGGAVTVESVEPARLSEEELSDCAAVFLAEALPTGDDLRTYVASGGSLVIIAGPTMEPASFNEILADERDPLSPAALVGSEGDERRPETYQSIKEIDPHHPVFAKLRRGETPIDLGAAAFYRICRVAPFEKRGARVLARFASGDPAIVERAYGQGRVVLVASALHTDTTNLPLKVSFLPLLDSLVSYLTTDVRLESLTVGAPVRLTLPKGAAPSVARLLRGRADPVEVAGRISGEIADFDFGPAERPGPMTLEWLGSDRIESRGAVVNVDPEEGNLDAAELPSGIQTLSSLDDLPALLSRIRFGRNLAVIFLIAALVVGVAETLAANRFAFGTIRDPKT